MKKKYLAPETESFILSFQEGIMNVSLNGNSVDLSVITATEEDDWDY